MKNEMIALQGLALALLPRTVLHAAINTSFYKELYRSIDLDRWVSNCNLAELPFVDKAAICAAGEAAVDGSLSCAAIQNTSGTTGDMLFLKRSFDEFEFMQNFYGEFLTRKGKSERPILMSLSVPSHGSPSPVPTSAFVLVGSVTSESGAARTTRYLTNNYDIPHTAKSVCGVSGGLWQVAALTGYLQSRDIPKPKTISVVSVTGDYVSPTLLKWLEDYWGERTLCNRYSLSEFFGGASQCCVCGGFHFDPVIVPELVSIDNGAVINTGIGRLALTALNPFVQMQPLIRYLTDDLFELRETCCRIPSFFYVGRIGHSYLERQNQSSRLLISACAVYDAVDSSPSVLRDDQTFGLAIGTPGAGKPRIATTSRQHSGQTILEILVANGSSNSAQDLGASANVIRRKILDSSPLLMKEVMRKKVVFDVVFSSADAVTSGALKRQGKLW